MSEYADLLVDVWTIWLQPIMWEAYHMFVESLNTLGASWWDWFAAVAWQASLFIGVVAVLDRAFGRYVWPQVRYAVWLLVFLKLILPPTLASPWSIAALFTPERAAPAMTETLQLSSAPVSSIAQMAIPSLPAAAPPVIPAPEVSWQAYAMLVWALGAFALVCWIAIRIVGIHLALRNAKEPPMHLRNVLNRATERAGLRWTPRLLITHTVDSPAVFGLFRPTILLPDGFPEEDAEHVLLHELAHVRRFDLPVHAVTVALLVIFWPNPLVWYALNRSVRVRELCTDGTVSRMLRERTPDYRTTLLNAARSYLDTPHTVVSPLGLMGLVEGPAMIVERLRHLERAPWRNTRLRALAVVATVLLLAGTVLPMSRTKDAGSVSEHGRSSLYFEYLSAMLNASVPAGQVVHDSTSWRALHEEHIAANMSDPEVISAHRRAVASLPVSEDSIQVGDCWRFKDKLLRGPTEIRIHLLTDEERNRLLDYYVSTLRHEYAHVDTLDKRSVARLGYAMESAPFLVVTVDIIERFPNHPIVPLWTYPSITYWPLSDRIRFIDWLVDENIIREEHITIPQGTTESRVREWRDRLFYFLWDVDRIPRPIGEIELPQFDSPATLVAIVSEDGSVEPQDLLAAGKKVSAPVIMEAARRLKFEPAFVDGEPVPCMVYLRLDGADDS